MTTTSTIPMPAASTQTAHAVSIHTLLAAAQIKGVATLGYN